MSTPIALPRANARRGARHPGCTALPVIAMNVVLGVPAYFSAYFIAYAFQEPVSWGDHLTFVIQVGAFALLTGSLALFPSACRRYGEALTTILGFGILTSLATNATAVGICSVASATTANQGSVLADCSTEARVLIVVALFGSAVAFCASADAVSRRSR